jgi:hypothetical protein
MKILMICKGQYYNFMPQIAAVLGTQHQCEVSAMTFSTPTANLKQMQVFAKVFNLAEYLKREVPHYSAKDCQEYLQQLEEMGAIEPLNLMVYADRIVSKYPFEKVLKILTGVCRFWKTLFDELQPDAVVGEVACASEWIAWSLAQSLKVLYLIPYMAPLQRGFFFLSSPHGTWQASEDLYVSALKRELLPSEAELAERFLTTFRTKRLRSPLHAPVARSPASIDATFFKNVIARAGRIPFRIQTYIQDGQYEVGSHNGTPPWEPALGDLLRTLRHLASESTIFDNRVCDGKKIYFPLHTQPEFTIDVRAPFCMNQLALIENIAKSAPSGYRVVVKEHPAMRGRRPLSYYRELKKLYNVQLVSPRLESHEIILNSDAVLTIVGTTAWEAILYEKPVIAFGPLCYRFFESIYECADVTTLGAMLTEAIRGFKPDRKALLRFIWAILKGAHDAEWHDPLISPHVLNQRNIDIIASAILKDCRASIGANEENPLRAIRAESSRTI